MSNFLKDRGFVFTGYFVFEGHHVKRDSLFDLVQMSGGNFAPSVTNHVQVLVVGYVNKRTQKKSRTKIIQAYKKEIEIIAFWDFIDALSTHQQKYLRRCRGKKCDFSDQELLKTERVVNKDIESVLKKKAS